MSAPRPLPRKTLPSRQRGTSLIDALAAMVILIFGMLGLTQFQTRIAKMGTEAQARLVATRLADELLGTMLVDSANAGCYQLPTPASTCTSAMAKGLAADWQARAGAALKGAVVQTALDSTATRLTVTITWQGFESGKDRRLEMASDVR